MKNTENTFIKSNLHENKMHGSPSFTFATYHMINANKILYVTSHWHRELEILCFQKGLAEVVVNGIEYCVTTGDIIFVNSGELHQIYSEDPELIYHACVFPLEFLNFAGHDYAQSQYLDPLSNQELLFPAFLAHSWEHVPPVFAEMSDIIDTYARQMPGYQLRIKSSLLKIISDLLQYHLLLTPDAAKSQNKTVKMRQLKNIINYIQNHYSERLTLEGLSDIFHMSEKYFSRYFKQNLGINFIEYLNRYRVEQACNMLSSADMPIMEISFSVGFHNFSYFIRKFKNITGYTPTEYREQLNIPL